MTIQAIIKEKGLSRYQLCKANDIPWATLADIYSGKTQMEKCSAKTLCKLSKALDLSMEEVLYLKAEPTDKSGLPQDKAYLETDLPPSIQKAIADYLQREKDKVLHLDCLWDELYGAINASRWDRSITVEQADYLRKKYLYEDEEVDVID